MKYFHLVIFTLIAIIFTDALRYISSIGLQMESSTYISAGLNYFSLIIMSVVAFRSKWKNNVPRSIYIFFCIWILWNIFSIFRGFLLAEDYWDLKFLILSSITFSLISIAFFYGENLYYACKVFKITLKYLFPLGFLLIPLTLVTNEELYSRLMIPVHLFILFIPFLKIKHRIFIFAVTAVSILLVIGFRSNIIKIAFSILLLIIFYFRNYIPLLGYQILHIVIFLIPIFFVTLALTSNYNILIEASQKEGYTTTNKEGKEENLVADTRTFLYEEVLSNFIYTGNWLLGEGAAGSYKSDRFYNTGGAIDDKRYSSEVGILNVLLKNGIVGVVIYFLLLFIASFIAINYSNNTLSKLLGLFIGFRWLYSFLEEFTQFDLNFLFFWIVIGLISSESFRKMNNKEIMVTFKSI